MNKKLLLLISFAFALSVNIYFRTFPVHMPQLKVQAMKIVDNSIQQSVMQEVQKKFPQFYYSAKDAIVKSEMNAYKKAHKSEIKEQARNIYKKMKERYQDDAGHTYLMELDCWHWGRYVENVVRLGRPGDETVGNSQWDRFMLAPLGSFLQWEQFLYYSSASLYKIFCIFKPVPIFRFLFYLPLLFATILISVLFFFSYLHGRHIGAIVSCLFVGLAPMFMPRSCAGWFDTDILNLLFPLLIMWAYINGSVSQSAKSRLIWIFISSFFVGLFCFTWTHWWFIFFIIVIYEITAIIVNGFLHIGFQKKDPAVLKERSVKLAAFLFFSFLWIFILAGSQPVGILLNQLREALFLNKPILPSIWPNVYSTVGELRSISLAEMSQSIGSRWLFIAALLCMIGILARAVFLRKYSRFQRMSITILFIWFVSMAFASSRGVRFVVFLLVPLGISLGWAINDFFEYFKSRKNMAGVLIVSAVFLSVVASITIKGKMVADTIFPLMDDTWYNMLTMIKDKTPADTIVNSWWDFGDWFKAVAKRRVIFDGQSQHTPQAYWMAKAMLVEDERKSIGILRMLNNGGNKAFEIINAHLNNQLQSVMLLESVIGLDADTIRQVLSKYLSAREIKEVTDILTQNPSRAGFVVDYSLPLKMPAISYLGNWDFAKVYIVQNFEHKERNQIMEDLKALGKDDAQMQKFYQEVFLVSNKNLEEWLSNRLQFYGPVATGTEKQGFVFFENGFIYNIKEQAVQSNSGQIPRSLFISIKDNIIEMVNPNANVQFSALIYENETDHKYKMMLLDQPLGKSIFVRLYYLNAKGLKHFMPFIASEEGDNYLRFFAILW